MSVVASFPAAALSPTGRRAPRTAPRPILLPAFCFLLHVLSMLHPAAAQSSGWVVRVVENAREIGACEGLGLPNATVNECGFCTGGSSPLPPDHGRDCSGRCGGFAVLDCAGVCGGEAYLDECSGVCIGGSSGRTERDVASFRDCRGLCTSSGGQHFTDSCGVCHAGTSPFQDCTNRCHLPGRSSEMARPVCGRCVGGAAGVPRSEVLDGCGNCRSQAGTECPCNGTGVPDPCGVCDGGGRTCMRVRSFRPRAVPRDVASDVQIEGAFRGRNRNLKCVFAGPANRTEFPAIGNGSHVQCRVRLPTGSYRAGVKMDVGDPPETDFVEEAEFLVYEEADYAFMSPSKAVYDRDGKAELTVTFSGGRVPPLPLLCIVTGEGWPTEFRLAPSAAGAPDTCVVRRANSSTKLTVAPSLDGVRPFRTAFPLRFYASPPDMRKHYVAEDGHAVMVVFDREVDLCGLERCSDILSAETLSRLGEGATCRWATKQQLIVTVRTAVAGNPIRVTFRRGVLKQDGQRYAQLKNDSLTIDAWYPQPSSSARIAISGPTTVSGCGPFTLVGHFSSPRGDAAFYWTAFRGDQRRLEAALADALLEKRSASLTLDASLLEPGTNYSFILTAEHPGAEKCEARRSVTRLPRPGPAVSAHSDVVGQPAVAADRRIVLQADVTVPPCVAANETVHLLWSVDNPAVRFDFKNRMSHVYVIEPHSLPENSEVTFTATAFFVDVSDGTASEVRLRVEPAKLRAAIRGPSSRSTGDGNGTLVLESEDPDRNAPLVYQWKCYDENRLVCYDYRRNSTEPLLVPRRLQNRPRLEVPCAALRAGDRLTFELQVFDARNRNLFSRAAAVTVAVRSGSLPQVDIESVEADGSLPVRRHPTTGAYDVPAGLPLAVSAAVRPADAEIVDVRWDVKGFSAPFTFTASDGKTFLTLEDGFLVGHGIYLIGAGACDRKGACGVANLTVHAMPGVALCRLHAAPHVEYEQLRASVLGCSVPAGRQPLTYQLHLNLSGEVFPLTPPQTSTVFDFVAPPRQRDGLLRIAVEVCDRFTLCRIFSGTEVPVAASERRAADRRRTVDAADRAAAAGDPLTALSLHLGASTEPGAPPTAREAEGALRAATGAVSNRRLGAGQLALVYAAALPLLRRPDAPDIRLRALAVVRAATRLAFGHQVKVPTAVLARGHGNAAEAALCGGAPQGAAVLRAVRKTISLFAEKAAGALPPGRRLLLESGPGRPGVLLFRRRPDGQLLHVAARTAAGAVVEATVRFSEGVERRFQDGEGRGRPCPAPPCAGGAVAALVLFVDGDPYPLEGAGGARRRRGSPVLDVGLRSPADGRAARWPGTSAAFRASLPEGNGSAAPRDGGGAVRRCFRWDEAAEQWSADGVETAGVEGDRTSCLSSHLTAVTVMEVHEGLSAGSVAGIAVASLAGLFAAAAFAFFFSRKRQARASRVSTEALRRPSGDRPAEERRKGGGAPTKAFPR